MGSALFRALWFDATLYHHYERDTLLLAWLTRTVKPRGNIASIGLAAGVNLETTVFPFILRGINLLGINSVFCPATLRQRIWHRLARDLRPRHINRIVNHVIPLEQITDVFQDYLNSAVIGRTVVKIASKRSMLATHWPISADSKKPALFELLRDVQAKRGFVFRKLASASVLRFGKINDHPQTRPVVFEPDPGDM
ncbi:MAG: hypothetical protein ACRESZ_21855 [Methylococcales bacterium]